MNDKEYFRLYELEEEHWWYAALHDLLLRAVRREKNRKADLDIFDAGCGTGGACFLMKNLGNVSGCDSSPLAVDFCSMRGLSGIYQADLDSADFGEDRFDVITSIDVLYHRNIKDDSAVVNALARALRPNGALIIQVPAYSWLKSSHDLAVQTARRYTRKQLLSLLKAAGLTVEMITYRVSSLFVPIALYRLARKVLAGPRVEAEKTDSDVVMPPHLLNSFLLWLLMKENRLAERYPLPFGLSLFAIARK